jgi:hypothetical protein
MISMGIWLFCMYLLVGIVVVPVLWIYSTYFLQTMDRTSLSIIGIEYWGAIMLWPIVMFVVYDTRKNIKKRRVRAV